VGDEAHYRDAVAHCRRFDPSGTGLAFALYSLGEFYSRHGGWSAARPYLEESAQLYLANESVGFAAQDVLYRLAAGEEQSLEPTAARIWWKRGAELLLRATAGSDPAERAAVFLYYASHHSDADELQGAEIMYRYAIRQLDKVAEATSPLALKAHAGLALVLERTNRSAEAQAEIRLATQLWRRMQPSPEDQGQILDFLEECATAAQQNGNRAAAEEARAEASRLRAERAAKDGSASR
jgi:hypothetical protein